MPISTVLNHILEGTLLDSASPHNLLQYFYSIRSRFESMVFILLYWKCFIILFCCSRQVKRVPVRRQLTSCTPSAHHSLSSPNFTGLRRTCSWIIEFEMLSLHRRVRQICFNCILCSYSDNAYRVSHSCCLFTGCLNIGLLIFCQPVTATHLAIPEATLYIFSERNVPCVCVCVCVCARARACLLACVWGV